MIDFSFRFGKQNIPSPRALPYLPCEQINHSSVSPPLHIQIFLVSTHTYENTGTEQWLEKKKKKQNLGPRNCSLVKGTWYEDWWPEFVWSNELTSWKERIDSQLIRFVMVVWMRMSNLDPYIWKLGFLLVDCS